MINRAIRFEHLALGGCLLLAAGALIPRSAERGIVPGERYLVITSDDAGQSPAVNAATIDAVERGLVSSVSMMTCCAAFDEFAAYARTHPQGDYGVHLTLTSELPDYRWGPLLPRDEVPSLVREDGTFWKSVREVAEHAKGEEAERELRAQIRKGLDAGIELTHLDHHMFVLCGRSDLFELYVRLAIEFDLPVRIRGYPSADAVAAGPEMVEAYRRQLDVVRASGMPVFDFIDDENYDVPPEEKRNYYIRMVRSLPTGVSEIVMHAAYDWRQAMRAPAADRREADTRVFRSQDLADEIRRLGIRVIGWREFRRMVSAAEEAKTSL